MNDIQSRKWQVTINNPQEKGYSHDFIRKILDRFKGCVYWCMSDEVGKETGTYHTHVFICCSGAVRFSTMQKRFQGAHLEVCKGTAAENRDYVFKLGKYAGTLKEETRQYGTQEEFGELPVERQGQRNDIVDLYDMIKGGYSDYQILEINPQYMLSLDKIERVRQAVLEERYKKQWRDLNVVYIYGETGSGKTRSVMDLFGYDKVYRITDYEHPFDGYKGQDIVIFEEFRSNLKITEMLNLLDGYPCVLRCRYANKIACFTKVFIISNIELSEQYTELQKVQPRTWDAFLRRIHEVKAFINDTVYSGTVADFKNGFIPVSDSDIPFVNNSNNV